MGGVTGTGGVRAAQERQDVEAEGCLSLRIKTQDFGEIEKGKWISVDRKQRELVVFLNGDYMKTLSRLEELGLIKDTTYETDRNCIFVGPEEDYLLFIANSSIAFKSSDEGYASRDRILKEAEGVK